MCDHRPPFTAVIDPPPPAIDYGKLTFTQTSLNNDQYCYGTSLTPTDSSWIAYPTKVN